MATPGLIALKKKYPDYSHTELVKLVDEAEALDRKLGGRGFTGNYLSTFSWALRHPQFIEAVIIAKKLQDVEEEPETPDWAQAPYSDPNYYSASLAEYTKAESAVWVDECPEPEEPRFDRQRAPREIRPRGCAVRR